MHRPEQRREKCDAKPKAQETSDQIHPKNLSRKAK